MEFGYFTLSDNHYDNNPRAPNQFVADITAEALYADQLGMHSVWIGEHHFYDARRAIHRPERAAGLHRGQDQARTAGARRERAAAAPSDSGCRSNGQPLICSAAAASISPPAAATTAANTSRSASDFEDNASIFAEGVEIVHRLWSERGPDHAPRASIIRSRTCASRRRRCRQPIPIYIASFSKPSIELAAQARACGLVVAAGQASAMSTAASKQRPPHVYREACAAVGRKPGRLITQLLHPFRRHAGSRKTRRARAAAALSPGMHIAGVPGRSEDRAGELPLFRSSMVDRYAER